MGQAENKIKTTTCNSKNVCAIRYVIWVWMSFNVPWICPVTGWQTGHFHCSKCPVYLIASIRQFSLSRLPVPCFLYLPFLPISFHRWAIYTFRLHVLTDRQAIFTVPSVPSCFSETLSVHRAVLHVTVSCLCLTVFSLPFMQEESKICEHVQSSYVQRCM